MDNQQIFEFIKSKVDALNFDFKRNDVEIEHGAYSIYGDDLLEAYENYKTFLKDY